jgi:hypothetical protein
MIDECVEDVEKRDGISGRTEDLNKELLAPCIASVSLDDTLMSSPPPLKSLPW